jgi:hypothetical protein
MTGSVEALNKWRVGRKARREGRQQVEFKLSWKFSPTLRRRRPFSTCHRLDRVAC